MKKGKQTAKSMPKDSGGKTAKVGLISTPSKLAKVCGKGK